MSAERLLEAALRARRFDEALLGASGDLPGHYHVSIGLEGTAAALGEVHRPGDRVITNYRNHAHLLALGTEPRTMFAEIFAREGSPQRGRSGGFHLANPAAGVPYTSAMVGGGVPLALGLGFALSQRRSSSIVFCLFGDGAFGEGVVHECLNLARLWELPVLFVCENNSVAEEGRANAYQSAASLVDLATVNQVAAESVNARFPNDVTRTLGTLADRVRSGVGPLFLEARAASWPGNRFFMARDVTGPTDLHDAARSTGHQWQDYDDPVLQETRRLLARRSHSLDRLLELDSRIRAEMTSALVDVLARRPAPADAAVGDVLAHND